MIPTITPIPRSGTAARRASLHDLRMDPGTIPHCTGTLKNFTKKETDRHVSISDHLLGIGPPVTNSMGFFNRIRNQTPDAAMSPSLAGIRGRYVRAGNFHGTAAAPWLLQTILAWYEGEAPRIPRVPPREK